jgi:tetratricopeptide (TPR) repeat protein
LFSEDYLMRIINQALAVLMTAIGLRKAGRYEEARQALDQAIEQLMNLPANIVDEMDDAILLGLLAQHGQLDVGRLAVLADLYREQGDSLIGLQQPDQAAVAHARALRFMLEVLLAGDADPSAENMLKVETLVRLLEGRSLPVDTRLALADYCLRLLEMDDQSLAAAGLSHQGLELRLAQLQDQLGDTPVP